MSDIISFSITDWHQSCAPELQQRATEAIESGKVLLFPQLRFPFAEGERHLLSPTAAGGAKNVSFDPASGRVRGSDADEAERKLLCNVLPRYATSLQQARTSYRPVEVAGRPTSWRKDDTRLHIDSFPSSPVQGRRILRVFTNVHPQGVTRKWRLGEPFEDLAQRYVRSIPAPLPGSSFLLNALHITKSRRSAYDHFMLQLHDRMKADAAYQAQAVRESFEFPADVTWMVYTDQVSHAAMGGQYALEQTFLLPVDAMLDPAQSPLHVLERLRGQALA
jgi:hypothetical protein